MPDKPISRTTHKAPPDLRIETFAGNCGVSHVTISATCTEIEHAVYIEKAAAIVAQLLSIRDETPDDLDGEWAE